MSLRLAAPRGSAVTLSFMVGGVFAMAGAMGACGAKERPPALVRAGGEDAGSGGASGGESGAGSSRGGAAGTAMAGAAGGGGGGAGGRELPTAPECIPRQSCQALCALFGSDPVACGLGTPSQCGCVCEERFNGPCPTELEALLSCAGDAPSVDCPARGRILAGCEEESFALEICDYRAREQLCAQSYPLCTAYCEAAVLSGCPQRPESIASCLCGCEASFTGACESAFEALMACAGDAPTFTCDGLGRPAPAGCESESQDLVDCLSPGSTAVPDAG